MILPNIKINNTKEVCPPLQWDETVNRDKIVMDCKAWLTIHYENWKNATINLRHHNYIESVDINNDTFIA